jgi:hypothetical protein
VTTVKVTDLRIWNQNGDDATMFDEVADAISLAASVELSGDLTVDSNVDYYLRFQVIAGGTGIFSVNSSQLFKLPEDWPRWWFTAGNNWGSPSEYTTAAKWGIRWNDGPVFGFRAILTAGLQTRGGWEPFDTFDVSAVRWFRLR